MTKVCLMCGDTFPDATTFCPKDGAALRAAVQGDDLIGEVFCDRYVVTDLLGEGGMGSVYVARDVRLPQEVAIKVLRERAMADPSAVARFRQEAEAASRINHDRVARVTDFGFMTDGRAFLVMEFVKGRTLKAIIAERAPLPPVEATHIARMVAEGLDAAHRLAIVHRDLKPENVMIVDDPGGDVRVKLLDFGIAKVLQSEESAGRTATGFVIGTPQWMSPEQLLGMPVDARSDVYALGLLVYSMLTGRGAFERGGTPEEEMMVRLTAAPNRLPDAVPGMQWPQGLQALLDRTLSREVATRPATALAFAQELAAITNRDASRTAAAWEPVADRGLPADAPRANTPVVGGLEPRGGVVASHGAGERATTTAAGGTNPPRNTRRTVLLAAVPVAVIALAFLGIRQWRAGDGVAASAAATNPAAADSAATNAALGNTAPGASDSNGAMTAGASTPNTTQPGSPGVGEPQRTAVVPNVAKPNTPPASPTANRPAPGSASEKPGTAGGGNTSPTGSAASTAAHNELIRVMDDADADVGSGDEDAKRARARETIRKLEQLSPRLSASDDRGYAYFYIGMSHATLGDNDKACASVKRAEPLASQSPALRSSVAQWQQLLKCAP